VPAAFIDTLQQRPFGGAQVKVGYLHVHRQDGHESVKGDLYHFQICLA
jgi:hypothetical protein